MINTIIKKYMPLTSLNALSFKEEVLKINISQNKLSDVEMAEVISYCVEQVTSMKCVSLELLSTLLSLIHCIPESIDKVHIDILVQSFHTKLAKLKKCITNINKCEELIMSITCHIQFIHKLSMEINYTTFMNEEVIQYILEKSKKWNNYPTFIHILTTGYFWIFCNNTSRILTNKHLAYLKRLCNISKKTENPNIAMAVLSVIIDFKTHGRIADLSMVLSFIRKQLNNYPVKYIYNTYKCWSHALSTCVEPDNASDTDCFLNKKEDQQYFLITRAWKEHLTYFQNTPNFTDIHMYVLIHLLIALTPSINVKEFLQATWINLMQLSDDIDKTSQFIHLKPLLPIIIPTAIVQWISSCHLPCVSEWLVELICSSLTKESTDIHLILCLNTIHKIMNEKFNINHKCSTHLCKCLRDILLSNSELPITSKASLLYIQIHMQYNLSLPSNSLKEIIKHVQSIRSEDPDYIFTLNLFLCAIQQTSSDLNFIQKFKKILLSQQHLLNLLVKQLFSIIQPCSDLLAHFQFLQLFFITVPFLESNKNNMIEYYNFIVHCMVSFVSNETDSIKSELLIYAIHSFICMYQQIGSKYVNISIIEQCMLDMLHTRHNSSIHHACYQCMSLFLPYNPIITPYHSILKIVLNKLNTFDYQTCSKINSVEGSLVLADVNNNNSVAIFNYIIKGLVFSSSKVAVYILMHLYNNFKNASEPLRYYIAMYISYIYYSFTQCMFLSKDIPKQDYKFRFKIMMNHMLDIIESSYISLHQISHTVIEQLCNLSSTLPFYCGVYGMFAVNVESYDLCLSNKYKLISNFTGYNASYQEFISLLNHTIKNTNGEIICLSILSTDELKSCILLINSYLRQVIDKKDISVLNFILEFVLRICASPHVWNIQILLSIASLSKHLSLLRDMDDSLYNKLTTVIIYAQQLYIIWCKTNTITVAYDVTNIATSYIYTPLVHSIDIYNYLTFTLTCLSNHMDTSFHWMIECESFIENIKEVQLNMILLHYMLKLIAYYSNSVSLCHSIYSLLVKLIKQIIELEPNQVETLNNVFTNILASKQEISDTCNRQDLIIIIDLPLNSLNDIPISSFTRIVVLSLIDNILYMNTALKPHFIPLPTYLFMLSTLFKYIDLFHHSHIVINTVYSIVSNIVTHSISLLNLYSQEDKEYDLQINTLIRSLVLFITGHIDLLNHNEFIQLVDQLISLYITIPGLVTKSNISKLFLLFLNPLKTSLSAISPDMSDSITIGNNGHTLMFLSKTILCLWVCCKDQGSDANDSHMVNLLNDHTNFRNCSVQHIMNVYSNSTELSRNVGNIEHRLKYIHYLQELAHVHTIEIVYSENELQYIGLILSAYINSYILDNFKLISDKILSTCLLLLSVTHFQYVWSSIIIDVMDDRIIEFIYKILSLFDKTSDLEYKTLASIINFSENSNIYSHDSNVILLIILTLIKTDNEILTTYIFNLLDIIPLDVLIKHQHFSTTDKIDLFIHKLIVKASYTCAYNHAIEQEFNQGIMNEEVLKLPLLDKTKWFIAILIVNNSLGSDAKTDANEYTCYQTINILQLFKTTRVPFMQYFMKQCSRNILRMNFLTALSKYSTLLITRDVAYTYIMLLLEIYNIIHDNNEGAACLLHLINSAYSIIPDLISSSLPLELQTIGKLLRLIATNEISVFKDYIQHEAVDNNLLKKVMTLPEPNDAQSKDNKAKQPKLNIDISSYT